MKGHGYRILGNVTPVFVPKDDTASGIQGKHLEWETVAKARRVASELPTKIVFQTFQGEIVGEKELITQHHRLEQKKNKRPSLNDQRRAANPRGSMRNHRRSQGKMSPALQPTSEARELLERNNRPSLELGEEKKEPQSDAERLRALTHKTSQSFRNEIMDTQTVPEIALCYRINAWFPSKVIGHDVQTDTLSKLWSATDKGSVAAAKLTTSFRLADGGGAHGGYEVTPNSLTCISPVTILV